MRIVWNPPKIDSIKATYSWGGGAVDYAADAHAVRPWTYPAIARNDLPEQVAAGVVNGDVTEAFIEVAQHLNSEFKDVLDSYEWGMVGRGLKRYKNLPTWNTITDSGALKDSQQMVIE